MRIYPGPETYLAQKIDEEKYRQEGESHHNKVIRIATALKDSDEHYRRLKHILGNQKFLPAGRVQASIGSQRVTTAFNCFVMGTIPDSMNGIMDIAKEAAETMRRGGGVGYDFSTIRPRGDTIVSLSSYASGPVSFMDIFNSVCKTVLSAGHRRGAQLASLRIDHPSILEFISAKQNTDQLTGFNISVSVTNEFMEALKVDGYYNLKFDGRVRGQLKASEVWDKIMESTWDWAEPGVLFIDQINDMNNLNYAETIASTNPCAEQPLPPYGACLLGSFNLVKYLKNTNNGYRFNFTTFKKDIAPIVRAMDNVIDRTIYPLPEQRKEAHQKRRIGLGVTGLANACEMIGVPYASLGMLRLSEAIFTILRDESYRASAELAGEKGEFPLYREEYLSGGFAKTLPPSVRELIKQNGIRNSHLLSFAPTGTISLVADNVSSGIEPVFSHSYERKTYMATGEQETFTVEDYAYARGIGGKTSDEVTVQEHLEVLALAQRYSDSAVSKTCNVGDKVSFEEFKNIYFTAWELGCKGITTFRAAGKRMGILTTSEDKKTEENTIEACYIDPMTGQKECS